MLQARCPFYMLVELSGSNAAHDGEKLDAYLEATMGDGVVAEGTVARDSAQTAALWAIREGITGARTLTLARTLSLTLTLNPTLTLTPTPTRCAREERGGLQVRRLHPP